MQKGVFTAQKKDGTVYYRASITYKKKHISLGGFDTKETAALAYNEACRLVSTPALSINSHEEDSPLPFEKWVVLLNFRDNDIYFVRPFMQEVNFFIITCRLPMSSNLILTICFTIRPTKL